MQLFRLYRRLFPRCSHRSLRAPNIARHHREVTYDIRTDIVQSGTDIAGTTIRETIIHVLAQYLDASEDYCENGSPITTATGLVDFVVCFSRQRMPLHCRTEIWFAPPLKRSTKRLFQTNNKRKRPSLTLVAYFSRPTARVTVPITCESPFLRLFLLPRASAIGSCSTTRWSQTSTSKLRQRHAAVGGTSTVQRATVCYGQCCNPWCWTGAWTAWCDHLLRFERKSGNSMENKIKVELELESISAMLRVLLPVSESDLFSTPPQNLDPHCVLASISQSALQEANQGNPFLLYSISTERAALNVTCIECQGPIMAELLLQRSK